MNFYKDPLLEKLRIIEARTLSEALSDDEFAELQQLRAQLGDDAESARLHAEADAVIKARAADFEKTGQTDPNKPPVDPNKKKPGFVTNPGTRAYQNWLNANGLKVAVDGKYGPETTGAADKLRALNKDFSSGGKLSNELSDMQGVGTAVNVKPQKTDDGKMMWIGSQGYLAAMKKYGYDPKTGDPIGGGPAKPASQAGQPTPNPEAAKIDAEIKRFTSGGNDMSLQMNKDYVASLEKKKAALSGSPQAAQPGKGPNGEPITKNNMGQTGYWKRSGRTATFVQVPTAESIDRIRQLSGI